MRPLKVAFIAPREVCRMENDIFFRGMKSRVTRLSSRGAMKATFKSARPTVSLFTFQ